MDLTNRNIGTTSFTSGGGKTRIDLPAVRAEYNGIVSTVDSCLTLVKVIQTKYFDGTCNVWNTPKAAAYIDKVGNDFNATLNEFNSSYGILLEQLNNAINALTSLENASFVSKADIAVLPIFSRSWEAQTEKFRVPEKYEAFTNANLTSRVNEIIALIADIQNHINNIVEAGLGGSFCTGLRDLFEFLKNKLSLAAATYDGQAAQKAVNEDDALTILKTTT